MKKLIFILLLLIIISDSSAYKQILYGEYNENLFSSYIDVPIVAVSSDMKSGVAGWMRIGFIEGTGNNIVFDERTGVDRAAIESAINAITFVESYLNVSHDYFISYDLRSEKVSGGSTGSSLALGIIALSKNKSINNNTLITGAIDSEGNLLETGGIHIKAAVAAASGYKKMIIPLNSSEYIIYEKHISGNNSYYMAKKISIIDYALANYGLEMSECNNLKTCITYIMA